MRAPSQLKEKSLESKELQTNQDSKEEMENYMPTRKLN